MTFIVDSPHVHENQVSNSRSDEHIVKIIYYQCNLTLFFVYSRDKNYHPCISRLSRLNLTELPNKHAGRLPLEPTFWLNKYNYAYTAGCSRRSISHHNFFTSVFGTYCTKTYL